MTEVSEKDLVNKAWMTEKSQSSTVIDSSTAEQKHHWGQGQYKSTSAKYHF